MSGIELPPDVPQYQQPFKGRIVRYDLPYYDVDAACGKYGERGRYNACAALIPDAQKPGSQACKVILPRESDVGAMILKLLMQHEIDGHCNGWPGDHPGARY